VARVLDNYIVALNAGSDDGVKTGDVATVYRAFDVKDPDTGDTLGTARLTIVRLTVYEVQAKFALGRTFESVATDETPTIATFLTPTRQRVQVSDVEGRAGRGVVKINPGDLVMIERPTREET